MKTLGAKNRNPLNIRYSSTNRWLGQRGQNKGFCVFSSLRLGFRAAFLLLRNYVRQGNNTIESIVTRWAPPSENDVESYIDYVCKKSYIFDRNKVITKTEDLFGVLRAMGLYESRVDIVDVMDPSDLVTMYNIHL